MPIEKIRLRSGIYYKHTDTTYNGEKNINQKIIPQRKNCCPKGPKSPATGEIVQIYKPTRECCNNRIIRSGVNPNVILQPRTSTDKTPIYKQNNDVTYYHNTAQRLRARNMSFQKNLPTRKNQSLATDCCRDSNGKLTTPHSTTKCCNVPIDKTNYGLYTKTSTSSGDRTFGYRHNNSNVYSPNNTEEQKKPNRICKNNARCYRR